MKLRGRRLLLLIALIALAVLPAAAQAQTASGFGRCFHAVVIGCQNYKHLRTLKTPLADAKAVAKVLKEQYGFTVNLLLDKNRDEIMLALSELRKTMTAEEDSLLIYYAGHGYLDEASGAGYWQPVDAEKDNIVYWLPTSEISNLLRAIRVRHVLVVADSCYSGEIVMRKSEAQLPAAVSNDEWLRRMQAKRSRQALTSGLKEPVMDGGGGGHSIFAKALLEALRENRQILDGTRLFSLIKDPVSNNALQQPVYDSIPMTGHEMGDFLLVPKELQKGGIQAQPEHKADLSFLQRSGGNSAATLPEKPRQNADLQKGRTIGQYIDYGDGTITDTKSGLMWKRCPEGLFGVNCEEGKIETYKWDDVFQRFKNIEYAGYSDWRLPTIAELKTLVYCSNGVKDKDYGRCNEGSEEPTINQQAFPNTEANYFWSGSPHADNSDLAWYVHFAYGSSSISNRVNSDAVRLVRGGW
ncbi:MAG: Caspase domain-containing protein [Candidatus Electronema aureum]|uniref:Caspase domain-containing protein n=1 Tax=Candidatus Electronema aureum TaxID=2005002 RepID=A0A521G008_9BACT|nr:MAG: Caspase domain-containing protein [Candidatus Electronema aureum]